MHRAQRLLGHITAQHSASFPLVAQTTSGAMSEQNGSSNGAAAQVTVDNWIGGQPSKPITGKYMPLYQPRDGTQTGQVALSGKEDVDVAVQTALKVYPAWSKLTAKARSQYIFKLREAIIANTEELAQIVMSEHGKTHGEALGSIQKGNETCEWACSIPQVIQGRIQEVSGGVTCSEARESLGVVACIVPFNFPIMVPFWTLPIAIAAGNCVILKPSEKVPRTMAKVMEIIKAAGIPDGVVQIVNGTQQVVEAICDHPQIPAISFVGSSKVAEIVSHRARLNNKRVLALGAAKNHLVALRDCNADMCSTDIVQSFTGCAGQRCMAASALIVVEEQQDLLKLIVAKAAKLTPGQSAGHMGPIIDQIAVDRCHRYIEEAVTRDGATLLLDGRSWTGSRPGYWIGPTIIQHKSPKDAAFREEIFGPILSIVQVQTREEAVAIENASPYGNAACIYTTVGAHAEWFTARFSAGMVGVNIGVPVPREPFSFGGWNASRFGDLDITGESGLEFWTRRKKITTKWNPPANRGTGDWMS